MGLLIVCILLFHGFTCTVGVDAGLTLQCHRPSGVTTACAANISFHGRNVSNVSEVHFTGNGSLAEFPEGCLAGIGNGSLSVTCALTNGNTDFQVVWLSVGPVNGYGAQHQLCARAAFKDSGADPSACYEFEVPGPSGYHPTHVLPHTPTNLRVEGVLLDAGSDRDAVKVVSGASCSTHADLVAGSAEQTSLGGSAVAWPSAEPGRDAVT